jgi:peptidoglycan/LPS O-acetylase OafA/YrhL
VPQSAAVSPAFSLYLDVVRLYAAVMVFLVHAAYPRFAGEWIGFPPHYGNDALTVFFVLSGYVIAFTADTKDRTPRAYALSRATRIYSVVIPAVALTWGLDTLGQHLAPAMYAGWWFAGDWPLWRAFAALAFLAELWGQSVRLFSNGPYWSICYEVWYYGFFAVLHFLRGRRRVAAAIAILLVIGPKIVALLPVWLLGVAAYRLNRRWSVRPLLGLALTIGSCMAFSAFLLLDPPARLDWCTLALFKQLFPGIEPGHSSHLFSSYVIGTLVACNFVGAHAVLKDCRRAPGWLERPIRAGAGATFSLYLYHYPLLQFAAALQVCAMGAVRSSLLVIAPALVVAFALAQATEHRKQVARALLETLLPRRLGRRL